MNSKDASANAAGYGYQYERALHRIFHSTHTTTRFGIETADDIEEITRLEAGTKRILEQDKLTTLDKKNPLQDSSKNLWNTLHNWLKGLEAARKDHAFMEFVLVTNKTVNSGTLAKTLSDANSPESIAAAITALRRQAVSMTGGVGKIAAEVIAFSDDDLGLVIEHLHVADGLDDTNLKEAIYAALQLPEGIEPHRDKVYESLLGFLVSKCLESWKKREPYWTTAQPFFTRKQLLFEKFWEISWKPLTQEQTDYKALSEEYSSLNLPFIDQLRKIKIQEILLQKELGHYWAAYSERTRLLADGRILHTDITEAESVLCDRWNSFRDAHMIRTGRTPEEFLEEDLKTIYAQTSTSENHEVKLGRVRSNYRYLFMGTYHHQANDDETEHPIHWYSEQDGDDE